MDRAGLSAVLAARRHFFVDHFGAGNTVAYQLALIWTVTRCVRDEGVGGRPGVMRRLIHWAHEMRAAYEEDDTAFMLQHRDAIVHPQTAIERAAVAGRDGASGGVASVGRSVDTEDVVLSGPAAVPGDDAVPNDAGGEGDGGDGDDGDDGSPVGSSLVPPRAGPHGEDRGSLTDRYRRQVRILEESDRRLGDIWAGKPKLSPAASMTWAMEKAHRENLRPEDAPTELCWSFYVRIRDNPNEFSDIVHTMARVMPAAAADDDEHTAQIRTIDELLEGHAEFEPQEVARLWDMVQKKRAAGGAA